MKKIFIILAAAFGMASSANAESYTMDEKQLEQLFANSTEVSVGDFYGATTALNANVLSTMNLADSKTRGGYLLRSFFCGAIALHRYYMGTTRKSMWAMYFCIPVVGGINGCVDFWWAVFEADAYQKYANNDKYIVWLD